MMPLQYCCATKSQLSFTNFFLTTDSQNRKSIKLLQPPYPHINCYALRPSTDSRPHRRSSWRAWEWRERSGRRRGLPRGWWTASAAPSQYKITNKNCFRNKNSCFFPYRIRKLYGKYFLKLNSWRKKHKKSIIYTSQAFVLFLIRFFLL